MKNEYDFSKGKRGAIEPTPPGKKRITIRLDNEIIEWFRGQVEARGGGNYQTMINNALREYTSNSIETFEKIIRRVLREEISKIIFNVGLQKFDGPNNLTVDASKLNPRKGASKK
jgi:hypothetical protein